jgi:acetyltransferase-like isoleucine patch superfamily enzyme
MQLSDSSKSALRERGIECFHGPGSTISDGAVFEPPCGIKWMQIYGAVFLGAFSYGVSGFFKDVSIGRYSSIGEQVQIGRSNHPLDSVSTSPAFYLQEKMFNVGTDFIGGGSFERYRALSLPQRLADTKPIIIGNDVYIGHGAFIMPGRIIGDGAVIAAGAVVTKDVPPYTVVAGVPAVVKRMRLPMVLAAALLELQWWRFAPWDLCDIDFWHPERAVGQLRELLPTLASYNPGFIRALDFAAP